MGLLDQFKAYIQANTPRATTPRVSPGKVINEGLLNPNQFNAPAANRFKDSLFGMTGIVPGVGDVASGVQAADFWNRGEKLNAGLSALGALPFIPTLHTVYHGSPHKFNKFDMSKIGTGEGAQAYGHGLYMAESPDVAKSYAEKLGKKSYKGKEVNSYDYSGRVEFADGTTMQIPDSEWTAFKNELEASKAPGQMYKVDIPDEAIPRMLDWDKPLSSQSDDVLKGLGLTYKQAYDWSIDQSSRNGDTSAAAFYKQLSSTLGGPAKASEFLQAKGIPGIRYMDGNSRDAMQGTSNFVLFDDGLTRVLEVNGQSTGLKPWGSK